MTINRLNQGTTNQVLVKAISGQTTNLLELQDSSGNVVSSIGPTGALGGTLGDSGLVHIETQTFSAVSSVNFSADVFTTTYTHYKLLLNITAASAAVNGRFRAAGSDYATGTYVRQYLEAGSTTVSAARNTAQTSLIAIGTQDHITDMTILNPKQTKNTRAFSAGNFVSSGNIFVEIRAWDSGVTNAFDSFSLIASSGTISGSMSLYAFKE